MEETHHGWIGGARRTVGGARTGRERVTYFWRVLLCGAQSQLPWSVSVRSSWREKCEECLECEKLPLGVIDLKVK